MYNENKKNFQEDIKLNVKITKKDKDGNIIGDEQND